jgi:hypothetical protein
MTIGEVATGVIATDASELSRRAIAETIARRTTPTNTSPTHPVVATRTVGRVIFRWTESCRITSR